MARSAFGVAEGPKHPAAPRALIPILRTGHPPLPSTPAISSTLRILQKLEARHKASLPQSLTRNFSSNSSPPASANTPPATPRTPPTPADSVSVPPPSPPSSTRSTKPPTPPTSPPKQADKVPIPPPQPFQNRPNPKPSISPKELNAFAVSQLSARPGPGTGAESTRKMDPKVSWGERYKAAARRWTMFLVAMPIAAVTSYVLYRRLVLKEERKKLVRLEQLPPAKPSS